MRSAKQWRELFHEKRGTRPLAAFILSDLSGYRDNAAFRTDDEDSLAEALDAMLIEGGAQHPARAGAPPTPGSQPASQLTANATVGGANSLDQTPERTAFQAAVARSRA